MTQAWRMKQRKKRLMKDKISMKLCLAGGGAFGKKHLDALALIEGVEVVSLVGRRAEATA